ncbi:C4-dicarboxylate-binding protein DctP [Pseudomonas sp. BIGb0408]|uniref:C4-dicarboxylate-binding protein DctP n=1 Tax=Phytopseudomonas flavescens TaxID=29435 RepID=A0A7Y9XU36_9GAMM|nr:MULTISPECIES: DctP family TRAP transporter solute-binding subunit [Pseudomonas]MCW2294487.1 C4-dicarboxylate-binding protein DctP [Pseudomonas sp. BIGb0408]NYH76239.1 C4-dicarboxylate-binding protein DctP [Pseudomonas flavescens]
MFKSVVTIALSALLLICTSVSAAEPIVIKFSHVVADDTPKGRGALLFKQLVEERLGAQVKVEVYPNSTLFGDDDELQALRDGKVQLLAPSLSKFDAYTKQLQVFDLPFLFDDLDAVKRFQKREKSRELLRSMAGYDIYGLAYWNNGMKQLSANRALKLPADAEGLTFRIQPSPVLEAQFAQLGASTSKIAFSDTLAALQKGTVQGAENPWSNLASQKLDSAQPFITETNHGSLNYMLISNSKFWVSIPYQVRVQLEAIIEEVSFKVNQDAEEQNRKSREQIVAGGRSQILPLTPEQRSAWREAMRPVWQAFEAEIGADVLRAAQTVNRR